MKHYYFYNLNGSVTGHATVRKGNSPLRGECVLVDIQFGTPFGGHLCEDGPTYDFDCDDFDEADKVLRRRGFKQPGDRTA